MGGIGAGRKSFREGDEDESEGGWTVRGFEVGKVADHYWSVGVALVGRMMVRSDFGLEVRQR